MIMVAGLRTARYELDRACLARAVADAAKVHVPGDTPEHHEDNTFGLPEGSPIRKRMKSFLGSQLRHVLGQVKSIGVEPPTRFEPLTDYTDPMASAMTPILGAYWDRSGKQVRERLGLDPDEWRVVDPHTHKMIAQAAFNFCDSTNRTTDRLLTTALADLRRELTEGVVEKGETVRQLTRRVQSIFQDAKTWKARQIATTEASRAVHSAALESARQSGVVVGKKWLLSSNACPLCHALAAASEKGIDLDASFGKVGENPAYAQIQVPPGHPGCRCSVTMVLSKDYDGSRSDAISLGLEAGDDVPAHDPQPKPKPKPRRRATGETTPKPQPRPTVAAGRGTDERVELAANARATLQAASTPEDRQVVRDKILALKLHRTKANYRVDDETAATLYDALRPGSDYTRSRAAVFELAHSEVLASQSVARTRSARQAGFDPNRPDLIPSGPIGERIGKYKVGDAKVRAIGKVIGGGNAEVEAARAEAKGFTERIADLERQAGKARDKGGKENHKIAKQADKEIAMLVAARKPLFARIDSLIEANQGDLTRLLSVERPVKIHVADMAKRARSSDGPLSPISGNNVERVAQARKFLNTVAFKGDRTDIDVQIGEAESRRAHFSRSYFADGLFVSHDYIQISNSERTSVVVHEMLHLLDLRLETGKRNLNSSAQEFLEHRVGDEKPISLKKKFGGSFDESEKGRKDKFAEVFGERAAYYVGKDYGSRATEINTMGVQKLYEDPAVFAAKDPEFVKYILGILDGSLR